MHSQNINQTNGLRDFLKENEIIILFGAINITCALGLRDYTIYSLMYLLGLHVGEVFWIILEQYLAVRTYIYKSKNSKSLFISKKGNGTIKLTYQNRYRKRAG